MYRTRQRAELLTHGQHTNRPYNLPEIGQKMAYKANRGGVAERCPEPAVQKSSEVDRALIDAYDQLLRDLELHLVTAAQHHSAHTWYLLRTVPGIGNILSLVLLYESHDLRRFQRVQDFVSSCRVVKWAKESAGNRDGTSGAKIGHAYLQGAFSEAAGLFLRNHPAGQTYLTRLEKKPGTGKALTVLAHQWARAIYGRLKRETAFDVDKFFNASWNGAGAPAASLDSSRISRGTAL